jgi:hypothetical protein
MTPGEAETPLARRFAEALAEACPVRRRIRIEAYTTAFLAVEPALATSPGRRARLAAAIEELIQVGILRASRRVDRSERPSLPQFVVRVTGATDLPVGREAAAYAWRPELAWAARTPLRRSEFEALKGIQVFLRERGMAAPIVPVSERSLEVFGDEKRLDVLRQNRRLFRPGRLSLDVLRAQAYAPPFAFRRVGQGVVALVLENVATYRSVLATLPAESPVGLVVFGGGGNFAASVRYFAELADAAAIREIRYFGDLDRHGLQIPSTADAAARKTGLPAVRPAVGLWATLLRTGQRQKDDVIDPDTACRLVRWLPASLRASARDVLTSGSRLAQEAVGTERLARDDSWSTWAGLGPPGVARASDPAPERRRTSQPSVVTPDAPTGESALLLDDTGRRQEPTGDDAWSEWVGAGRTRHWVLGDPIVDWLRLYGRAAGFVPDDERPAYDPRTDFRRFVLQKGLAFETAVMRLLERRSDVVRIATCREDAHSLGKARDTLEALRAGVGVVAQAVLRNPNRRTYGVADLLVRSDLLASWFPELLSWEDASVGAPGLGHAHFHYRAVDLKFHTFELTADGHVGTSPVQLAYAVQVWLYTDVLGRLQGYLPPAGYLIGRTWKQGDDIGDGCLDRLARVDIDRWLANRHLTIGDVAQDAVAWIRRVRAEGGNWRVLPEPSIPELYPHARNAEDAPWHAAKNEIAKALRELTLLPGMNRERRRMAHAAGIKRWDHPGVTAARLGITSPAHAVRADAVLAANRTPEPTVVPDRLQVHAAWRDIPAIEFYVDFETVSNLEDDFAGLPQVGGQAQIVQIGCGHVALDSVWRFAQWTVDSLTVTEERRIIDAWVAELVSTCACHGIALANARICHWSAAEPINLETAYNAARQRHPDATWPTDLPWFDVLERVIRAEPVAVTGSFNFGLKSIAKAMHAAGLITQVWRDGPTDGLGAMLATWSAAREATATGVPLSTHPLMVEIARYNEIDCRAMSEIVTWLRENR